MRSCLILFLLLLCPSSLFAQITGPTQADVGDLVVLESPTIVAKSERWQLLNNDKKFKVYGNELIFSSGVEDYYHFQLITVSDKYEITIYDHIVQIGGSPAPDSLTKAVKAIVTDKNDAAILNTCLSAVILNQKDYKTDADMYEAFAHLMSTRNWPKGKYKSLNSLFDKTFGTNNTPSPITADLISKLQAIANGVK